MRMSEVPLYILMSKVPLYILMSEVPLYFFIGEVLLYILRCFGVAHLAVDRTLSASSLFIEYRLG